MSARREGALLRVLLGLALILLLAACAPQRAMRAPDGALLAAQEAREARLAADDAWTLHGRLAVSDGSDGGSGQLRWEHTPRRTVFDLRAPVSRQTWRLTAEPDAVRIDGLEGGPRHGRDAEALLRDEIGWNLPLANLGPWVRGMRGEGRARIEFDRDGLPALIEQAGWRIEYRGWHRGDGPALPSRVFASRGEQRVRLAIQRWDRGE
jgi:outer membrane lipoprotein LolB